MQREDLKNHNVQEYIDGGDALYVQCKYKEAFSEYTKAIQLDPKNAQVYAKRAAASLDHYHYGARWTLVPSNFKYLYFARNDWNKAIDLDPENSLAYTIQAERCRYIYSHCADVPESKKQQESFKAINLYVKALLLDPQNNRASRSLIKMIQKMSFSLSQAITILPPEHQIALLKQCFEPNTALGALIQKQGLLSNPLKEIGDRLTKLDPAFKLPDSKNINFSFFSHPIPKPVEQLYIPGSAAKLHNKL